VHGEPLRVAGPCHAVRLTDELRGGILLGTDEFVAGLKPLLSDYEALREIPRRERLATRPSLDELFSGVLDKEARNRQIHAAARAHECTLRAVADFLELDYSTISMIAKRVAGRPETSRVKVCPPRPQILKKRLTERSYDGSRWSS